MGTDGGDRWDGNGCASVGPSERVLLVASSGGHLLQLRQLADLWESGARHWVTFDRPDARALLAGEHVIGAYWPTNRNLVNLARNSALAVRTLRRLRPRAVVSTGAGVAIPFLILARLFGSRAVYVESLTRVSSLSLTGRAVYWFVHAFFVQWPELARRYRRARYEGSVFDLSQPRDPSAAVS